jgi:hypothetical protein
MVQGKWNITMQTPMGEKQGVLELETTGNALTGYLTHAEYHAPISEGRIEGNTLSWTAKLTQPLKMNFKFTATIEADRISGAAKYFLGKVTFTGTRAS